ncbi:hypothetical protein GTR00_22085, partial [Kineococcus sp. T90]|nr:hypothetical protein [Kineococcus indalonis]
MTRPTGAPAGRGPGGLVPAPRRADADRRLVVRAQGLVVRGAGRAELLGFPTADVPAQN